MTFVLAMVQMAVAGGKKERNLAAGVALIREAAEAGAQVVVLPECFDVGWNHPSALREAERVPGGAPFRRLADAAKRHSIYLCAGLTERAGRTVFNSAVLIDPKGDLLVRHRKINEMPAARCHYSTGNRLGVVDTEYGCVGVLVCSDAFARGQSLSRALCCMGAEVILSPSSWVVSDKRDHGTENPHVEIWRENYRPVAEEYDVWIAGVSNVGPVDAGPAAGKRCIGASLLFGPGGKEVLQGPYGIAAEAILYAEVEPARHR